MYTVRDRGRELDFEGELLGSSSSHARGKPRWLEVAIYKTVGGSYVVAGVGKTTLPNEQDREWAQVSTRAEAVLERLRLKDEDGVWYIPATSMRAIEEAAEVDAGIREALYAPQHIA